MRTLLLAVAVLAAGAQAQSPEQELRALLDEFLAGAATDAAVHQRFWAEDLVYTSAAGQVRSKPDIMKAMRAAPAPQPGDPKVSYSAEDVSVRFHGDGNNIAVVNFRLVGRTEKNGAVETARYRNTGMFLKRDGRWQVVAWQATRIADP
jgi:uncharacterized protein (TIGR02246 family)